MDKVTLGNEETMRQIILSSGKTVLAAEPYRLNSEGMGNFEGREPIVKMIIAAWLGGGQLPPLCPLLIGEPGVGKNRTIYELSRRTAKELYIFQGHEDVTAEDLACSVRFSDDVNRSMDYVLSPLVTAMHRGGICFIDEIGKIRPRALALLVSVLDERRYIDSTLLGERVHAHPGFRFVAATNTGELNGLPEFIKSRIRPVIEVGPLEKELIEQIIRSHLSKEEDMLRETLDCFWNLWGDKHPSPRDAIQLIALASSLSDYEHMEKTSAGSDTINLENNFGSTIKPDHLKVAYAEMEGYVGT